MKLIQCLHELTTLVCLLECVDEDSLVSSWMERLAEDGTNNNPPQRPFVHTILLLYHNIANSWWLAHLKNTISRSPMVRESDSYSKGCEFESQAGVLSICPTLSDFATSH